MKTDCEFPRFAFPSVQYYLACAYLIVASKSPSKYLD